MYSSNNVVILEGYYSRKESVVYVFYFPIPQTTLLYKVYTLSDSVFIVTCLAIHVHSLRRYSVRK